MTKEELLQQINLFREAICNNLIESKKLERELVKLLGGLEEAQLALEDMDKPIGASMSFVTKQGQVTTFDTRK